MKRKLNIQEKARSTMELDLGRHFAAEHDAFLLRHVAIMAVSGMSKKHATEIVLTILADALLTMERVLEDPGIAQLYLKTALELDKRKT